MAQEATSFKKKIKSSSDIDFTTGNLFWKIILFTLPVIFEGLLQLVYTSADLLVVDLFGGGKFSMAAVGDNGSLISLIVYTFIGISTGANVVVAAAKGAGDKEKALKVMSSSLIFAVVVGIFVGVIGYRLAYTFLKLMSTPSEIIDLAATYLRIYFLGVPFMMIFNFGAAMLRAMGDSKRPLLALSACGVLNIGMNILFVLVFKMDVAGVAIATVISEGLEAFLILYFLSHHKKGFVSLKIFGMKVDGSALKEVLHHGLPAGLESLVFSISNVIIQAQANKFDAFVVSGNTASDNVEGYIFVILQAFATAVASVVSQNYGANKKENLRKTLLYSFLSITVLGFLLGGIASLLRYQLIGIFIHGNDEGSLVAMGIGTRRLILMGLSYWLCALMDAFSSYLRGIKHPIAPTVVTIFCACLFRLFYVYVIYQNIPGMLDPENVNSSLLWLYASYPISWLLADLTYTAILPHFQKIADKEIDARLVLAPKNIPNNSNK